MNIGIIGYGFVGKGVAHAFSKESLKIYDKYGESANTLEETVMESTVLFVCVPTPMQSDGSQDLYNISDAIKSIVENAYSKKAIVIRTTVVPETTRRFARLFPEHDFVFIPEFLSERTSVFDSLNPSRIIIGGIKESMGYCAVKKLFNKRFPHVPMFETTWEGAELAKYMANCFYATKLTFMNEMYSMAEHLGVDYDDLKAMLLASGWVADMHMQVPGTDGDRGYGGKCFPKDMKAFINWAEKEGLSVELCKAADKVNETIRVNKNWFDIKGATSTNNYKE